MPASNDKNTKREMGYHGSNMHGYSLHEKKGQLDRTSVSGVDQRESTKEEND
ncbi:hypothetical protein ACQCN2_03045 [Brevibacillus ginsengisoli]|uniref:hypothetical protein n=1 Tax=Brevibacillus ginsengisoli TaxID=363854 RepID=UPI003CFA322B